MFFNLFQSPTRIIYCPIYPKSGNPLFTTLKKPYENSYSNSKESLVDLSTYETFEFSSLIIEELRSNMFVYQGYDNSYYLNKLKRANGLILHFEQFCEINTHCKAAMEEIVKILKTKQNVPVLILFDAISEVYNTNNDNYKNINLDKVKLFVLENLKKCFNGKDDLFQIVDLKDSTYYNMDCYEPLEWLFEKIAENNL